MRILIIFLFCLALIACDNRFEFVDDLNNNPVIGLTGHPGVSTIIDSLKTGNSIKFEYLPYSFGVSVSDPENKLQSLEFNITGGGADVRVNGDPVNSNHPISAPGNFDIEIDPSLKNGNYSIQVSVVDNFSATSKVTVNLFVFDNLVPVPSLVVNKDQINGPYSAVLNASGSKDQDVSQGGGIDWYVFSIKDGNGTITHPATKNSSVPWVFAGPGGYEVSVTVYDNDGANVKKTVQVTF